MPTVDSPFALTLSEVCEELGANPNTFTQSLHQLFVETGDARKLGNAWAYNPKMLWQWKLYVNTRRNLINAGEWSSKRPYSLQDMEDITVIGMYEDYMPETK